MIEATLLDPEEICLPKWMGLTDLSLEEIGAITVLVGMLDYAQDERMKHRMQTEQMKKLVVQLTNKGIFSLRAVGKGKALIKIDLDDVIPEDRKFLPL